MIMCRYLVVKNCIVPTYICLFCTRAMFLVDKMYTNDM